MVDEKIVQEWIKIKLTKTSILRESTLMLFRPLKTYVNSSKEN